jgi:hypothetical protein
MSEAHKLFLESRQQKLTVPISEAAIELLKKAADLWRTQGKYFSAGIAMSEAVFRGWGNSELTPELLRLSLDDFEKSVADSSNGSPCWLASVHKLRQQLIMASAMFFGPAGRRDIKTRVRELGLELCESLLHYYQDSEQANNYLVRGFCIISDLEEGWEFDFPAYEVPVGAQFSGEKITLNLPSAFHILVDNSDWQRAYEIIEKQPEAFTSAGLKGWRCVVLANKDTSHGVEHLDQAADFFAADQAPSMEELQGRGGSWTSINPELWAKYFRARARLLEAIRNPERVKESLVKASEIIGDSRSGWHHSDVARFRVLVNCMKNLVSDDTPTISVEQAREEYLSEVRMSGPSEEDPSALMFITEAATAIHGFRTDPASEITKTGLAKAVDALARVPTIGPDIANVFKPAIGESAMRTILGPIRTWMHRSLASITDEAKLRAILLALLRAGLPLYAQLRHGPLEFGKDVVALVEENGAVILRCYQVKCGDIDKKKWRETKDELEEMFRVKLPKLQLPMTPQRIEGFLVTNGHANPYAEPDMDSWFAEQREKFQRCIEFMHLDKLVDWITRSRLTSELRIALKEQGIPILSS